ncbi:MAG: glutaredoxin [Clostridia bacterium]|jgi:glutaredoxin-like YruB-family protein|nr:glutaredoxin [Clostridia bacterium]
MKKIEIYTTESCSYCHAAKDFFRQNNISFTEHDITKDTQARKELMRKGYRSVPLIIIGDKEISGFDREELTTILKL